MAGKKQDFSNPIFERIRSVASNGNLSHAYFLTGNGNLSALTQYLAQAMVCEGERKPCGVCNHCRKVAQGIHPDVTVVEDPEHKMLPVKMIRTVCTDAYVVPNEARRKVYIFPDCSIVTEQDQNTLLKIVEEGPPYCAFLFCAENSSVMIKTLRSRCMELKMNLNEEKAKKENENALDLCRVLCTRKKNELVDFFVRMEKKKVDRDGVLRMMVRLQDLFAQALIAQYSDSENAKDAEIAAMLGNSLTKRQLIHTIEMLKKLQIDGSFNVSANNLLAALSVELEEIL